MKRQEVISQILLKQVSRTGCSEFPKQPVGSLCARYKPARGKGEPPSETLRQKGLRLLGRLESITLVTTQRPS